MSTRNRQQRPRQAARSGRSRRSGRRFSLSLLVCQISLLWGSSAVAVVEPNAWASPPCGAAVSTALDQVACFEALLQLRQVHPAQAAAIDAQIEAYFSQTLAIAVLDMAGFSRTTAEAGIIAALAQIYQVRAQAQLQIEAAGGRVLKLEADNIYAVFPTVEQALSATQTLTAQLGQAQLSVSAGIGFGPVLVVGDRDVFGHEMNLASKLGEDVAAADEIWLTASAQGALTPAQPTSAAFNLEALNIQVSGIVLQAYRLRPEASGADLEVR